MLFYQVKSRFSLTGEKELQRLLIVPLKSCFQLTKEGIALRTRTIDSAFEELKKIDPNTAVSKHYIRQLIISNKIPYRKAGNKYLFDFDRLVEYLEGGL